MKRIFALALCAGLLCGVFTGCRETAQPDVTGETGATTQPTVPTTQSPAVTVTPVVVYNEDGVKVTVTGFEPNGFLGAEVKLLVENDTKRNVVLSGDYFVVNGITVSGFLYAEAAAGKKTNDTASVYAGDLKRAGIDTIAIMEFPDARIVDSDSHETIDGADFSLKTSAAPGYVQKIDDSGIPLFTDAGITVIGKMLEDDLYGKSLQLLVKNAGDEDVIVEADNVSVNGFTVDAWLYDTVYEETVRFSALELFSDSLKENGITAVEEISFVLRIMDAYSYDPITQSGELTVTAN